MSEHKTQYDSRIFNSMDTEGIDTSNVDLAVLVGMEEGKKQYNLRMLNKRYNRLKEHADDLSIDANVKVNYFEQIEMARGTNEGPLHEDEQKEYEKALKEQTYAKTLEREAEGVMNAVKLYEKNGYTAIDRAEDALCRELVWYCENELD